MSLYSGTIGDQIFRTVGTKQVVYAKPAKVSQPRTEAQMEHRAKWGNRAAFYRAAKMYLQRCFEGKQKSQSYYNLFVRENMLYPAIYLPKEMVRQGGGIAGPYTVSRGTLASIQVNGSGTTAKTDIYLDNLTLDENTSVKEFAKAVVTNNLTFKYNDQLSFMLFLQGQNQQTGVPIVYATGTQVNLTLNDERKLLKVAGSYGFAKSDDGYLSVSSSVPQGSYAWIHSRKNAFGATLVSSQTAIDNNPLLAEYSSDEARLKAMVSYGLGEKSFITPDNPALNTTADYLTGNDTTSGGESSDGGESSGGGSGSDPL